MTAALIVAAGSGERLGAGRPKAFVPVAGRALLAWSVDALTRVSSVGRVVVALPPAVEEAQVAQALGGARHGVEVCVVDGGGVRSESVRRALAAAGEAELVLVHDAARPLVTKQLAESVIAGLAGDPGADAAIAAAPVADTIKRVDERGTVLETLDRSRLWAVQTPQVFRLQVLARALEVSEQELARATDDAWLVERAGGRVVVVAATAENLKVTTPHDLRVAELLLGERERA